MILGCVTLLQRIGSLMGNSQWLACPQADAARTAAVMQAHQIVGDQLFLVAPGVVSLWRGGGRNGDIDQP